MSTVYEFATTDNIIPAMAYTLHLLNNPPLPDARSRKLVGEAARRIASKEAVFDQNLPMTYEEKKAFLTRVANHPGMRRAREKYCTSAGLEWIGPDPLDSFNMRWGKKYSRTKKQADYPTAPNPPPPKKPKHEPPPALDPHAAPWAILGIDSSDLSDATIKKAYFKLTRIHHPDKGGNEENFKIISAAYNAIKTDEKRTAWTNDAKYGFPTIWNRKD